MSEGTVVACIPALNEERNIGAVIVRTKKFADKIVVCDDGSLDLTGEIAEGLGAIVIRHGRNMGYGAALRSLFSEALSTGFDFVVTLDADGQHDPTEIPRLLKALTGDKADIVIGSRFVDGGESEAPIWREQGIKLISGMVSNGEDSVTDAQSGFRAYTSRALQSIMITEDGMGASTEILLRAQEEGLRIAEVPIRVEYARGSSSQNPITHGFDVVLSTFKHLSLRKPLLFYGLPGFVLLCLAAAFWVWTLRIFAVNRTISTNIAIIALSGTIMGGMLMTIAIILWAIISVIRQSNNHN
jgi:glycosyltransferase involved in cell wall biosynthesis